MFLFWIAFVVLPAVDIPLLLQYIRRDRSVDWKTEGNV